MEKIEKGKYVELGYDLYEVNGKEQTLVHQTDENDPERFVFGFTQGMIEPLEKAVEGLAVGETFDIIVKAEEAFGPHDPEQVATLPRDIFEVDGKFDTDVVVPGAVLPMMTADGFRINGVVAEVTETEVKMDFNHPLAGKDVRFNGKIITVRQATETELNPPTCGCGSCGGGDCGSGCDCDDSSCGCGGCN